MMEWIYIQPFEEEIASSVLAEELRLLDNVQTIQHSRYLTPQKACSLWKRSLVADGVSSEQLDPEFWLQVRRSTFPLSGLTDQEKSTLQEFLLRLLETVVQTGVTLLTLWFLVKLLRDLGRGVGADIQIERAHDVAIDRSTIDKSEKDIEGIQPVPPRWKQSPEDVEAIEVVVKVPQGYAKPVFVALIPPNNVLAFARNVDYLECRDVPSELVSMLQSGNEVERCRAAHFLAIYGDRPEIRIALSEGLSDPSPAVRATIIDVLGELKAEEGVPRLIRAIEDPNETIQNLTAIALARIGTPDALAAIVRIFKEAKWEDATLYLVMQSASQAIVHAILEDHQQVDRRRLAWYNKVLVTFPYLATEVILQVLESDQEAKKISALLALQNVLEHGITPIKEEQVHRILDLAEKLLAHDSFEIRYHTIRVLGRLKNPKAIGLLAEALQHDDVNTRAFAAYYLKWYHSDPGALKHLSNAYRTEPDKDLRKAMSDLLGKDRPKSRLEKFWGRVRLPLLILGGVYIALGFAIRQMIPDYDIPYISHINMIMLPFYVFYVFFYIPWLVYDVLKRLLYTTDENRDVYWHVK